MNRRVRKSIMRDAKVGTHNTGVMVPPDQNPMHKEFNIGRNELCHCGSGKKYKNCCLINGAYENYK